MLGDRWCFTCIVSDHYVALQVSVGASGYMTLTSAGFATMHPRKTCPCIWLTTTVNKLEFLA